MRRGADREYEMRKRDREGDSGKLGMCNKMSCVALMPLRQLFNLGSNRAYQKLHDLDNSVLIAHQNIFITKHMLFCSACSFSTANNIHGTSLYVLGGFVCNDDERKCYTHILRVSIRFNGRCDGHPYSAIALHGCQISTQGCVSN